MTEDFLHFTWKHILFDREGFRTTAGERIKIIRPGFYNRDAGPDFFDARLEIDGIQWAGNVEIHINSSDWKKHGHHHDEAYNNVILHVVFNHDEEVYNTFGKKIPVAEIAKGIQMEYYNNYKELVSSFYPVSCRYRLDEIPEIAIHKQLERALISRLERKTKPLLQWLSNLNGDWEEVAFVVFARALGQKTNSTAFEQLAFSVPHKLLKKNADSLFRLEAILFGQAGMLHSKIKDEYFLSLKKEYLFHREKNSLSPLTGGEWRFGRMRPANFPTLRIAQFASTLHRNPDIFHELCAAASPASFFQKFYVGASSYWNEHYHFGEKRGSSVKHLGKQSINGILINAAIPLLFAYGVARDEEKYREKALEWLSGLKPEYNRFTRVWMSLGVENKTAADSQAMIEQFGHWCEKKKCVNCGVGTKLIKKSYVQSTA